MMIYNPWASTSTNYKEMAERMDELIDAYERGKPEIRSYLKFRPSEHSKYKNYDIYVSTQYLERKIGFEILDRQVVRIWIKVYKKDKLVAGRTINCLKNTIKPWVGDW